MGAPTYVKFCKIGALCATGTRPYADGADGFVMGEGAALFVLKRLEDAERDGDRVSRCSAASGRRATARARASPPRTRVGQKLAVERAWKNAGLPPSTASFVEGHGTSTRVGDVVEVGSLMEAFGRDIPPRSIPLGSVKSNIGHLKGAAGAAGLLKTVLALHEKALPPSLNFDAPNPNIDFEHAPFYVNTELQDVAHARLRRPPRRGERVRVRRHEFPRRARGTRSRAPALQRQGPVFGERVPRWRRTRQRLAGVAPQGSPARGPRAGRRLGGRASEPPA